MRVFRTLNDIGEVYIPTEFRDLVPDDAPLKHFANSDLGRLDRIFTHLRRRGVAVLSGEWKRIVEAMDYVDRKKKELVRPSSKSKRNRDVGSHKRCANANDDVSAISRLMCYANEAGVVQVDPSPDLPYLLELVGEDPGANNGRPFLLPIATVQKLKNAICETHPIPALGTSLFAFENVLVPRSQATIECFLNGLQAVKKCLPHGADVLEIGCGSGCLTLLAAQELADLQVKIYASDLLPEAVATTRLNIQHFSDAHSLRLPSIQLMPPGNLFDAVLPRRRFDLIIFNAPWIVSRARNRGEIAIHDENQKILTRFLHQAPEYLKADGRLLLGYADASGPKAISNLEAIAASSGFTVENLLKKRVATHRSKRKWEHIMIYELAVYHKHTKREQHVY